MAKPIDDPAAFRIAAIITGVILTIVTVSLFWLARRAARGKSKLVLLPDEQCVADIFVETKQVTWGGLTLFGSPYEGKLILTTHRVLYTNPNERKIAFALGSNDITKLEKGARGAQMTLELEYTPPKAKQPKRVTFVQIGGVGGMLQYVDASKQMPIGMFIDKLLAWKQVA